MIKYFCDYCGDEILRHNDPSDGNDDMGRLKAFIKNGDVELGVEVITAKNRTWNAGHFCKYCILAALYKLDDRPKQG